MWQLFSVIVVIAMVLDYVLSNKHKRNKKWAYIISSSWVLLGILFSLAILDLKGQKETLDYLTGYLLEKSLSIDNLLVIISIFTFLNIPEHLQKRVLYWGVMGAAFLRLGFVKFGVDLIHNFSFIFYLFGAILCYSGISLFPVFIKKKDIKHSFIYRFSKKILPLTDFHGEKFVIFQKKALKFTPLFLALVLIELSDVIFAVDSIPAILSITDDVFIAFSSNFFAVLGLRSLHVMLSHFVTKLPSFQWGASFILIFIGFKMLVKPWIEVSNFASLIVIIFILSACCVFSNKSTKKTNSREKL